MPTAEDLSRGIEVVKTYLEMPARVPTPRFEPDPEVRIERVLACPHAFYRFLYREVGRPFHWVDRLDEPDERIAAVLANPGHELWLLSVRGAPAGYYELLREPDGTVQLLYFGLLVGYIGRGLGKRLLAHAVETAWDGATTRLIVNTCTLDGPAALPTYLRAGFTPVGEERYVTAWVPDRCDHCRSLG